jgi:hypothetical protein
MKTLVHVMNDGSRFSLLHPLPEDFDLPTWQVEHAEQMAMLGVHHVEVVDLFIHYDDEQLKQLKAWVEDEIRSRNADLHDSQRTFANWLNRRKGNRT